MKTAQMKVVTIPVNGIVVKPNSNYIQFLANVNRAVRVVPKELHDHFVAGRISAPVYNFVCGQLYSLSSWYSVSQGSNFSVSPPQITSYDGMKAEITFDLTKLSYGSFFCYAEDMGLASITVVENVELRDYISL
jgi:hypothetical protein